MRKELALARELVRDEARFIQWFLATSEGERQRAIATSARLITALEDPTPGHLAMRLDPLTVQTPALDIIDNHLVQVRDAIDVMLERRVLFARLVAEGVEQERAVEIAADEIGDDGIDRLIVSMPPQEGKSERISRYQVLWLLRQFPTLRIGLVSYDGANAATFSYKIRADIELFNGSGGNLDLGLRLAKDQAAISRFMLTTGGSVYAIGIGGGLTGRPLDLLLIDDPVKDNRAAESLLQSQQAADWYVTVARPRLAPWAPVEEVATRWHAMDLGGRFITKQAEDEAAGVVHSDRWTVVNIPAQAEHDPEKGERDILGREPGQFMLSARGRTEAQWLATKNETPARFWSALYQGRPSPEQGKIWLAEWWRYYDTIPWTQRADGAFTMPKGWLLDQSWDMAFKSTASSDYVACGVFAKKGSESLLLYVLRARLTFTQTCDALLRVSRLFPQARAKFIEEKANGAAVIDALKKVVPGLTPISPNWGSKTARAEATSPYIRAGNLLVPTPAIATANPSIAWDVDAYIEEATAFDNGAHDDQVDMTSQYLAERYLRGGLVVVGSTQGPQRLPDERRGRLRLPAPDNGKVLTPMQVRLTRRAQNGR